MNAYVYDTLDAASRLEAAGMERGQAEAVAKAIRDGRGELATKADITRVEDKVTRVEDKVTKLEEEVAGVKTEVAGVKIELKYLTWAIGFVLAAVLANLVAVLFDFSPRL